MTRRTEAQAAQCPLAVPGVALDRSGWVGVRVARPVEGAVRRLAARQGHRVELADDQMAVPTHLRMLAGR